MRLSGAVVLWLWSAPWQVAVALRAPATRRVLGTALLAMKNKRVAVSKRRKWNPARKRAYLRERQLTSLYGMNARQSFLTIGRVLLPTLIATAAGVSYYDNVAKFISENFLDSSSMAFLSSDEIQFIPSFLTVLSLLFSILAGNAYSSLYEQQEEIYFALYAEVSEAKSLLEQMALICAGRPFYLEALRNLRSYIKNDLRRLDVPPDDLISLSPSEDPLESIMYLTSVGVPSVIYETVRDLRKARGRRLGAMQRKFPRLGITLLYILAMLELAAFPLLGAGTAGIASESIFEVQGALFGGLCGATTLVLRIIQELWRTSGGAFNVDIVLAKMVRGLVEELDMRASLADARMALAGPSAGPAVREEGTIRRSTQVDEELDYLRRRVAELEDARQPDRVDRGWRRRLSKVFRRLLGRRKETDYLLDEDADQDDDPPIPSLRRIQAPVMKRDDLDRELEAAQRDDADDSDRTDAVDRDRTKKW